MRRIEQLLRGVATACAMLLMLVSLNGRTVWHKGSSPSPAAAMIRDAAGWDWVARGAGAVAVASLMVSRHPRQRYPARIVGAALAMVVFCWSGLVSWHHWMDLSKGVGQRTGWVMEPATNLPSATIIAVVATAVAFMLTFIAVRRTRVPLLTRGAAT